jgi:isopenicillin N synthase-like dioxygenase
VRPRRSARARPARAPGRPVAPAHGSPARSAASTVGFFTVTNHGIAKETIEAAFAASAAFFAHDLDAKREASPFAAQLNSGYEYMSQVRPSTGTADQKESLQMTAREGAMDGRWPTQPPTLEPASRALMDASHGLAARILDLLEPRACPSVVAGTLAGAHRLWSHDGQCTLRMLHYPPTAPPEPTAPGAPQLWRAGPHTDWCCVTLLFQLPGNEGLECAANPRVPSHKGWMTVDPVEGGVAVNIGDMLSRWSDGRLLSNLHRVRMPTAAECTPPRSRYSIGFFMQADKHALIAPEQSEPITAGEYILGRIRSNFEANFKQKEGAKEAEAPAKKQKA